MAPDSTPQRSLWTRFRDALLMLDASMDLSLDEIRDRRIARLEAEIAELRTAMAAIAAAREDARSDVST